jgi:hypothetical protein
MPPSRRTIKPRPAVTLRPSWVSDETAFAVLGITPRRFREVLIPRCSGVVRMGHTVLVSLDAAEAALQTMASGESPAPLDLDETSQPKTADAVLEMLGRRRAS